MKYFIFLTLSLVLLNACRSSTERAEEVNYRKFELSENFNDSLLVYSTLSPYVVKVEDIKNNKLLFSDTLKDLNLSNPILDKHNNLYYSPNDEQLVCVNLKTNKKLWSIKTDGQAREFKFVNDSTIVSSIRGFGLVAIDSETGKIQYKIEDTNNNNPCLATTSVYQFTFDGEKCYANDLNCNDVIAYQSKDGKEKWAFNSGLSGTSMAFCFKKYVFLGITGDPTKNEGAIYLLDPKTGKIIFDQKTPFDLITKPIFYKNKIIYLTYDSKLNELDLDKMKTKIICQFKDSEEVYGQMFLAKNFLYFKDYKNYLNRINLETYKKERIAAQRDLLYAYKNGKTTVMY